MAQGLRLEHVRGFPAARHQATSATALEVVPFHFRKMPLCKETATAQLHCCSAPRPSRGVVGAFLGCPGEACPLKAWPCSAISALGCCCGSMIPGCWLLLARRDPWNLDDQFDITKLSRFVSSTSLTVLSGIFFANFFSTMTVLDLSPWKSLQKRRIFCPANDSAKVWWFSISSASRHWHHCITASLCQEERPGNPVCSWKSETRHWTETKQFSLSLFSLFFIIPGNR